MIYAHIGDQVLEIQPESNSSAAAFVEQLTVTAEPGDLILYQGIDEACI